MRTLESNPCLHPRLLVSTALASSLALGLAGGAGCNSGQPATKVDAGDPPAPRVAGAEPDPAKPAVSPAPAAKTAIGGLKVGAKAPEFSLDAHQGGTWSLAEQVGKGPVVLVFYRGDWCPKCRAQLEELQGRVKDFSTRDATLVALSVDERDKNRALAARLELEFPLLADPELATIRAFEVEHEGEDIARPAVYLIGEDRQVVWAWVGENPADRPPIDTILQAIDAAS